MKMKLMWGVLMAIAFASCTQEDVLNNGAGHNTLRASMEETGTKTRVGFTDRTAEFFWTKGDKIGVTTTSSQTFQGMTLEGEGGQATGTFSGTFNGTVSGYAVYPYGAFGRHSVAENTLTYTLPAEYTYTALDTEYAKSDGNSHNAPMWGSISNGSVAFKHLGGVIAFSVGDLPESTQNLEFVLTATNQISGSLNATLTDSEPKIVASESNVADADKKVTITFSTAAGQTSGYFYIPVPTGSLGNLSLVIYNGEDEVATGAWDNVTIARKDIKRATIGSQSIIGGNGEIKQVASVSDVNDVLTTEEDNLTVQVSNEVTGTNNTIEIPAALETTTTTFSFASVAEDAKITIEDEDGGSYDGKIIIEIPADATLPEVVANIPYGEVYIKQGTVTTLVAYSADNTTIIGANAIVGTLTVAKGNVRIEDGGKVTKIERATENTETVYVVYESATAPEITTGEGVVLMSAGEWDLRKAAVDGGEVKLTSDVVLTHPITIAAGKDVVLNLDGKTISGTATDASASNLIIVNAGANLTIKNGTIWSAATNPDTEWGGEGQPPYPGYANNTISNRGTLTIDNAKIENKTSAGGASYVIDNYDGGSLTVNNGEIIQSGNDVAIRMFASSANNANNVTINGGTITGKRGVWIQLAGSATNVAPNVNLNIIKGTLTGSLDSSDYILAIYSYSYGNDMKNVKINISDGTFNGDIALTGGKNKDNIESLTITGGTFNGRWGDVYSYGTDNLAATAIKITGGNFSHLYPLKYMEGDNGNINVTLAKDVKVGNTDEDDMGSIVLPAGNTVTLDLNGQTISQTSDTPVSMITNNGNLTIKDSSNGSGKIAFTFNGTQDDSKAANAISNRGTLVVEGGEISNTGTGNQIGYAIDNYNGSTLTVAGGKITASGSSYYDGIRLFCGSNETTVTVNKGEISTIWAQNPSENKATEVSGTVIINGGTVGTTYYENYTTVKVKTGVTATVTPYGAGNDNTTSVTEGEYTVYSFVRE